MKLRVGSLLFLALVMPALAITQEYEPLENDIPLENDDPGDIISGLVVDRTVTRIGKDFYDYFVSFWRTNYPQSSDTFAIYELPSARFGSQIWIDYRGRQYAKQFIGPIGANNRGLPEAVARYMHDEIQTQQLLEQMLDTFDMERSEL